MHRCEVKIQRRKGEDQESLIACGDHANKKIGGIWMCNHHYAILRHLEEYETTGWLKGVTDYTNCKD